MPERDPRVRHGRPITWLGARLRRLRRATRPLRDRLRGRSAPHRIQRSASLAPDDDSTRRMRWHVLVDLVHERCRAERLVVVEVGARDARTSAHLLRYCPQIAELVAIDRVAPDSERLRSDPRARVMTATSPACSADFPDGSLDLVFIDADHAETAVAADLEAWVRKVRPGGIVAGHDYGSDRHPGVTRAVDRFCAGHPHPLQTDADMVWWTLR